MRPWRRSLRARIIWSTTLVTAIAMVAMVGTVILIVTTLTRGRVESALSDKLSAVEATVVEASNGNIRQLDTSADTIEDSAWVFDLYGTNVVSAKAGKNVQSVVGSLSGVAKRTRVHQGDHLYLADPVINDKTGKPFAVVVVAESLAPYQANQNIAILGLIALGLAVTGGTAAIAAWTIGRTLDPVNNMAFDAEDWSEHNLESRFEPGSTDNEIAHLGRTLNVLLDRVAATIRGEQLLTSELAHELRTPLTAIRGEAELGLMKNRDPDARERFQRVVDLVDRMSTTITTLVSLARGGSTAGQRADVVEAVTEVVGGTRIPEKISVDTTGVDDALEVGTTLETLERALAPLVDNALRFATSTLTISTSVAGRMVRIHVSDDGPGVDPSVEIYGSGLGLSLSRRVARTLGGDIRLTSESSPTTFTLDLPAY